MSAVPRISRLNSKQLQYKNNRLLRTTIGYGRIPEMIYIMSKLSKDELCEMGYFSFTNSIRRAVKNGNLNIVDLFVFPKSKFLNDIFKNLLEFGYKKQALDLVSDESLRKTMDLNIALINSIQYNCISLVKFLIDHGVNVHGKHNIDYPLELSIKKGYTDISDYLTSKGAKLHDSDYTLEDAVEYGNYQIVKKFLNKGVSVTDINAKSGLLLRTAVQNGYLNIAILLVENGADVKYVPLKLGIMGGPNMFWYLLELGLNPHDNFNELYEYAVYSEQQDIIDYLRAVKNRKLRSKEDEHGPLYDDLIDAIEAKNIKKVKEILPIISKEALNRNDVKVLDSAVRVNSLPIVKLLVEHGADINDHEYYAIIESVHQGNFQIFKYLIDAGTEINDDNYSFLIAGAKAGKNKKIINYLKQLKSKDLVDETKEEEKLDALMDAIESKNVNKVKSILKSGISVETLNWNDVKVLDTAVRVNSLPIVKLLVEYGVNLNDPEYYAIKEAAHSGNYGVFKYLIDAGTQINDDNYSEIFENAKHGKDKRIIEHLKLMKQTTPIMRDSDEDSDFLAENKADIYDEQEEKLDALMDAIEAKNVNKVQDILNSGISLETLNLNDVKVLDSAVRVNSLPIVKLLVQKGVDLNDPEYYAIKEAVAQGNYEIFKYLIDAGTQINDDNFRYLLAGAKSGKNKQILNHLQNMNNATPVMKRNESTPVMKRINEFQESEDDSEDLDYVPPENDEEEKLDQILEAIDEKNVKKVQQLLSNVSLQTLNLNDVKVLDAAVRVNSLPIVKLLVQKGVDLNDPEYYAIKEAVAQGNYEIFKYLIDAGTEINDDNFQYLLAGSKSGKNKQILNYLKQYQ